MCDSRISAVSPFPGLRRFPDGRDFKQWTGDDSKALMKVHAYIEWLIESGILTITFEVFLGAIAVKALQDLWYARREHGAVGARVSEFKWFDDSDEGASPN